MLNIYNEFISMPFTYIPSSNFALQKKKLIPSFVQSRKGNKINKKK